MSVINFDEFFDALESYDSNIIEDDQMWTQIKNTSREYEEEDIQVEEGENTECKRKPLPPSIAQGIPSPDKAAGVKKRFSLDECDIGQTTLLRSDLDTFVKHKKISDNSVLNKNEDKRSNGLLSSGSLRDLLEKPGGKLAYTNRVDPIIPPSECPLHGKISESSTSANFIKRHVRNSTSKLKRSLSKKKSSLQSSPVSTESHLSPLSASSSKTSLNSIPLSPLLMHRNSPTNSRSSLSPPPITRDPYTSTNDILNSLQANVENQIMDSKRGINSYHFKVLNEDTGDRVNINDFQQTISPFESIPNLLLRSSSRDLNISSKSLHSAEIAAARALSPSVSSIFSTDESETKQRKRLPFGKMKKKAMRTKNNRNKSRKMSTSISNTQNTKFFPSNSIPVRFSNRKTQSKNGGDKKKSNNFYTPDSNNMLLLQTLQQVHDGPIWCSAFSPDGKYLATGGKDHFIHIWEIIPKSSVQNNNNYNFNDRKEIEKFSHDSPMEQNDLKIDIQKKNVSDDVKFNSEEKKDRFAPAMLGGAYSVGTEIQLFNSQPIISFVSHSGDIIDLSWSTKPDSKYFLLSASVDHTVKLWHISRSESILTFQHSDLVTSVYFHPQDENYFLSAGFDKKIRLWHIPTERVQEWAGAPEIITKARFCPDGQFIVAGLISGQVYFYSCHLDDKGNDRASGVKPNGGQGLRYYTQIACRNRHGSHKTGKKVTGLEFVCSEKIEHEQGNTTKKKRVSNLSLHSNSNNNINSSLISKKERQSFHLLITTNDSRMRLYGMNDFCMERKFKGLVNTNHMIGANFNESGEFTSQFQ